MPEPDFKEIAYVCSGMLAPAIYRQIYEAARTRPGGNVVEVGTARGAATVAMALGVRDSGRPGKVMSFGRPVRPAAGRGRSPVFDNFEYFGVSELVEYYEGLVEDHFSATEGKGAIGLLMLDADGCIDRDLRLFYDRLTDRAKIVIDDYVDSVRLLPGPSGSFRVDAKMRLTFNLLNYFCSEGFVEGGTVLANTFFGQKASRSSADFHSEEILRAYRSLIFATAPKPLKSRLRRSLVATLDRFLPRLAHELRVEHRDRKAAANAGSEEAGRA